MKEYWLKENVRYYYIWNRHEDGSKHPIGCVCMAKDIDGTIYRGVSICSAKDMFRKVRARGIAFRNAAFLRYGLKEKKHGPIIMGRVGSKEVAAPIKMLFEQTKLNLFIDDKFYAKASFVGSPTDGGIQMSKFEESIWDESGKPEK